MHFSSFSSKSSVFYFMQSAHYSAKGVQRVESRAKGTAAGSRCCAVSEPRSSADVVPLLPATAGRSSPALPRVLRSSHFRGPPSLQTQAQALTSGSASWLGCIHLFVYGLALARQSPRRSNGSMMRFGREPLLPALGEPYTE